MSTPGTHAFSEDDDAADTIGVVERKSVVEDEENQEAKQNNQPSRSGTSQYNDESNPNTIEKENNTEANNVVTADDIVVVTSTEANNNEVETNPAAATESKSNNQEQQQEQEQVQGQQQNRPQYDSNDFTTATMSTTTDVFNNYNQKDNMNKTYNDIEKLNYSSVFNILFLPLLTIIISIILLIIDKSATEDSLDGITDTDSLRDIISNYLFYSIFTFTLLSILLIIIQLNRYYAVNSNILNESSSLRNACLILSMFPFSQSNSDINNTHHLYKDALMILKNYTLQAIWETMSYSLQLKNMAMLKEITSQQLPNHPYSTLPLIISSIPSHTDTRSQYLKIPIQQYAMILNTIVKSNSIRLNNINANKIPKFILFLLYILIIIMYIGFTFNTTNNKWLDIILNLFIIISITLLIYFICDLDDLNNGNIKVNNQPLWIFLNDINILINSCQNTVLSSRHNNTDINNNNSAAAHALEDQATQNIMGKTNPSNM